MEKLQVTYLPIDSIHDYEMNAKIHTAEQVEQIKKSIQEFGDCDPCAIDENNALIEGHGRILAMKQLGVKEVPCIILKHLTESQKKAYRLIHNKLTMNTGFNIEMLQKELQEIDIPDIDMEDFDFILADKLSPLDTFLSGLTDTTTTDNQPVVKKIICCPHCGKQINNK